MEPEYVLDASALLAWLNGESGGEKVEPILGVSSISTVNLSETIQKSLSRGVDTGGLVEDLEALGLRSVSFTSVDAVRAARLWPKTKELGLSLADRCCLATARRFGVPAVTADADWNEVDDVQVRIELIR